MCGFVVTYAVLYLQERGSKAFVINCSKLGVVYIKIKMSCEAVKFSLIRVVLFGETKYILLSNRTSPQNH